MYSNSNNCITFDKRHNLERTEILSGYVTLLITELPFPTVTSLERPNLYFLVREQNGFFKFVVEYTYNIHLLKTDKTASVTSDITRTYIAKCTKLSCLNRFETISIVACISAPHPKYVQLILCQHVKFRAT